MAAVKCHVWCKFCWQKVLSIVGFYEKLFNQMFFMHSGMVKVEPEYDDNMVTCSQMVYDCYASEKPNQVSFLF